MNISARYSASRASRANPCFELRRRPECGSNSKLRPVCRSLDALWAMLLGGGLHDAPDERYRAGGVHALEDRLPRQYRLTHAVTLGNHQALGRLAEQLLIQEGLDVNLTSVIVDAVGHTALVAVAAPAAIDCSQLPARRVPRRA